MCREGGGGGRIKWPFKAMSRENINYKPCLDFQIFCFSLTYFRILVENFQQKMNENAFLSLNAFNFCKDCICQLKCLLSITKDFFVDFYKKNRVVIDFYELET